jgi:hypothetical protein
MIGSFLAGTLFGAAGVVIWAFAWTARRTPVSLSAETSDKLNVPAAWPIPHDPDETIWQHPHGMA